MRMGKAHRLFTVVPYTSFLSIPDQSLFLCTLLKDGIECFRVVSKKHYDDSFFFISFLYQHSALFFLVLISTDVYHILFISFVLP